MASKKTSENKDAPLALPALSLLAPPLRLVSAAMWKVMKRREVMHYGTLEELVTSSCEAVPGLLTSRHQAKLALGLRGRLILELCRGRGPLDPEAVLLQLERIRAPVPSSAATKRDVKVENTVRSFRELVHELLRDPAERELFNEEFPVDYGPPFDLELEKLLWEFLLRLDSLFPVPNFAQTVSWLSAAPAVLEECAQAPCQPQLLKTLLQHQKCLGHIESAASLPPCMGDSILISLSLPPSGRVPESHPSSTRTPSCKSGPPPETGRRPEPVIGLMSNEDLPIMASANRIAGGVGVVSRALDEEQRQEEEEESEATRSSRYTGVKQRSKGTDDGVAVEQDVQTRRSGTKRPLGDAGSESEEEEEEAVVVTRRGRKRRSLRDGESGGEEESVSRTEGETCTLPDDPEQRRLALRCRQNDRRHRPRVLVRRLSPATCDPGSTSDPGAAGGEPAAREPGSASREDGETGLNRNRLLCLRLLCLPVVDEDRELDWIRSDGRWITQPLDGAAESALRSSFDAFPYPTLAEMSALALRHALIPDRVRVWFLVRRLRYGVSWNGEEIDEVRAKLGASEEDQGGEKKEKKTGGEEKSSSRANEEEEEEEEEGRRRLPVSPSQASSHLCDPASLKRRKPGVVHGNRHAQLWHSFWENQLPSRSERLRLHEETGLKMATISKWFNNQRFTARCRQKRLEGAGGAGKTPGRPLPLRHSRTPARIGAPQNRSGVVNGVGGCDRRAEKEPETQVEAAANQERTLGVQGYGGGGCCSASVQTEERSEAVVDDDEKKPVAADILNPTGPEEPQAASRRRLKNKTPGQLTLLRHIFLTTQWPNVVEYGELERLTGLARRDITQWFGDMRYLAKKFKVGWMTVKERERVLVNIRALKKPGPRGGRPLHRHRS